MWLNFVPRSSMLVLRYDDLRAKPESLLSQVSEFLEIADIWDADISATVNAGSGRQAGPLGRLIRRGRIIAKRRGHDIPPVPTFFRPAVSGLLSVGGRPVSHSPPSRATIERLWLSFECDQAVLADLVGWRFELDALPPTLRGT